MAVEVTTLVWKTSLPPTEKFVLLALADYAHKDGSSIFPAVGTLARKVGRSERRVQQLLRSLEWRGLLVCEYEASRHSPRRYRIDLAVLGNLVNFTNGVALPDRGEIGFTEVKPASDRGEIGFIPRVQSATSGVRLAAPDPSLLHPSVEEPSSEPFSLKRPPQQAAADVATPAQPENRNGRTTHPPAPAVEPQIVNKRLLDAVERTVWLAADHRLRDPDWWAAIIAATPDVDHLSEIAKVERALDTQGSGADSTAGFLCKWFERAQTRAVVGSGGALSPVASEAASS